MSEQKSKEVGLLNAQIGGRLREIRKGCGHTQEEFAETLNLSVVQYRKLEGGSYRIRVEHIVRLYKVYHIDPTFLLTGAIEEKPDIETFLTNCTEEEKIQNYNRVFAYLSNILENRYRK